MPQLVHDQSVAASPTSAAAVARSLRIRTGLLLFVILSLALAPMGGIGIYSALQSLMRSDAERQALLDSSTREQAQNLARRMRADRQILERALRNQPPGVMYFRCDAASSLFGGANGTGPVAQIVDGATGAQLCTANVPPDREAIARPLGTVRVDPTERGLTLTAVALDNGARAEIFYPEQTLLEMMGETDAVRLRGRALQTAYRRLDLTVDDTNGWFSSRLSSTAAVGRFGVTLQSSTGRAAFESLDGALTLAIPIGMWLLAVLLSWLIVDTMLLTPVSRLRGQLMRYHPGDRIAFRQSPVPTVAEISTLEDMVSRLVDRVADDKAVLAHALDQQRVLTREVHHRVKNNLQIIASLISLHSRDSKQADAQDAYRTIQRRVDALAVVYRHLQAEGEEQSGVAVNTLLSDLANGLQQNLVADRLVSIHVDAVAAQVSQDVALPIAFFVTELTELALLYQGAAMAVVSLMPDLSDPSMALLSVASDGLRGTDTADFSRGSYARVLQGLSRQLRQPLIIDAERGRYSLAVPLYAPRPAA